MGVIAIAHGLDNANAAGQTILTGKPHSSYGAQAISSLTGLSEQNAELSYDLVSIGANLKLMANAAKITSPSYRVFESGEEALQAYPHLFVEQEHIPSGVVNGSKGEAAPAVSIASSEAANDTPIVVREHGTTPSLTENISSPFERETSTWPEMRAQFMDKKLPTSEFTMMVDGEKIESISREGGGAAVFRVKDETTVKKIFMHMAKIEEMPPSIIKPKGTIYSTKLDNGTKVALRNFANSEHEMGAHWTLEFAKIPGVKVNRMEIKFVTK